MSEAEDARTTAASALVTLRLRVDDHFDRAHARASEHMRCSEGCEACCHVRLSVFAIEAAPISAALDRLAERDPGLREQVRRQARDPRHADRCALLVEGRCVVYDERPLICRSHGLAVAVNDDGRRRVEHCPLNFVAAPPPPGTTLDLEAVNRPLAVMATMWDGRGERVALEDLAAGSSTPSG